MNEKEFYEEMWTLQAAPIWGCVTCVLGIVSLIVVAVFLVSCKTVHVPVESVHTDTLIINKWQHDSVFIETLKHDSITIREKGDTVFVSRWHTEWRDRWRDLEVHDTLVSVKVDSVQVPYPVEKKLGFWEKAKMASIGFSSSVILIAAIGLIIWIRRHFGRK